MLERKKKRKKAWIGIPLVLPITVNKMAATVCPYATTN